MPEFFRCLMEKFDSISHFLQSGEFSYRVYDMGRKVLLISNDEFEEIENQQKRYPYPFQKHAWLALLFWDVNNSAQEKEHQNEPIIWFLKFPVDEIGYLQLESRDGFLIALLEQAGKNIQAKQLGNKVHDELTESPFAFKPQADRLAMFHAFATVELGQPPSQYYQHARDYLSGDSGFEQWQFLGLQGIADVVARLAQDNNEVALARAISKMPLMPLESFCQCLEHAQPTGQLAKSLLSQLNYILEDNSANGALVSALVRSLSASLPASKRRELILNVISSSYSEDIEVLVAISGRAWQDLGESELLTPFIDKLSLQNQDAFNAVLIDLMMLPDMKQRVLKVLRSEDRSQQLSEKLFSFMKLLQGSK